MSFRAPIDHRLAYDRDGTVFLVKRDLSRGGDLYPVPDNALQALNGTNGGGMQITALAPAGIYWDTAPAERYFVFIFPVAMDLSRIFTTIFRTAYSDTWGSYRTYHTTPSRLQWSPDTTNGVDGEWLDVSGEFSGWDIESWDTRGGAYSPPPAMPVIRADTGEQINLNARSVKDIYRSVKALDGEGQQALNLRGVRGLRVLFSFGYTYAGDAHWTAHFIHLYGRPSGADELTFWHPTLDRELHPSELVWADASRPSSAQKSFRIKNRSSAQTRDDVGLRIEREIFAPNPDPITQLSMSLDGSEWSSYVTLGDMTPGQVSPVVRLRRSTASDAALGSNSPRVSITLGETI